MKNINSIKFISGSKEESLPDFNPDFPYISTCSEIDKYDGGFVPWHWHKEVEIFYMQSGTLEYYSPGSKMIFAKGSGGIVNSDILHMTKASPGTEPTMQLLHIFDTGLISGGSGSRIEKQYILPFTSAPQLEILGFYPDNHNHQKILDLICQTFSLEEGSFGYEVKIRSLLSDLWLQIFQSAIPVIQDKTGDHKPNNKLKKMLLYIQETYPAKISVTDIAAAAYISERECYRVFQQNLLVTPNEYLKKYRLHRACKLLAGSQEPVTGIGQACGLGSSSYFGKEFRRYYQCTPLEYRAKWQNNNIS